MLTAVHYFSQLLKSVSFSVPVALWDSKQMQFSIQICEYVAIMNYEYSDIPLSIWHTVHTVYLLYEEQL